MIDLFFEESGLAYRLIRIDIGTGEPFQPQVGGPGPMSGLNRHFRARAPEKRPYAIDRYTKETHRLYGGLDKRLAPREFVGKKYSIAAHPATVRTHEGVA